MGKIEFREGGREKSFTEPYKEKTEVSDIILFIFLIWLIMYPIISWFGYVKAGADPTSAVMIFIGIMNVLGLASIMYLIGRNSE